VNFFLLLFPDFALVILGWLVCRYTPLGPGVWRQVDTLVYYFLFPVLLFQAIVHKPLDLGATSGLIGAGVTLGLAGIALAHLAPRLPLVGQHLDLRDHAASAQVAFRFNSYITLAIIERVAGPAGVALAAVLIGFCVPMFNVAAVWPMARHSGAHLGAALARNPLILATVSGLMANLAGLSIPSWLEPSASRISAAAIALGLMAAGAGMQFSSLGRAKTLAVVMLSIKHLWLPLLAAGLARLFGLDALQTLVLVAFAAMPTAPSAYVLASSMGYNGALVGALVTLSTALGAISLSLALGVLVPTP
jgi:malonate transporter